MKVSMLFPATKCSDIFKQEESYDLYTYPLHSVLAISPKDMDALVCKAIANIQLGNYDAALTLISKHGTLSESMIFEKVFKIEINIDTYILIHARYRYAR
jgi:hypothetical protein